MLKSLFTIMAEKDRALGSIGDIEEQIRKLEKEKEELERLNEQRRLEQRLQHLQENVSMLKSAADASPAGNQTSSRNVSSKNRASGEFNTSLEDSQARLRSLQQSILNSSLGGTSAVADDSNEELHRSSDDADELDDVMSAKHKQALRINRDVLVENMTPDDIFNDLISKHVLTNSDVSRIKEKNTTEAINEELLNVLIRRSDKAFHVFVSSLRRTLQGWLANRLDPGSQPSNKRKRRTGEMSVNVDVERVVPARSKHLTCTCQEVEEQILLMAKGAFAHIRRRDASPAAFEQFRKELQQTNMVIKESMEIRNTLKELCRHGDLVDLSEGSVCFTIRCASLAACQGLWDMCLSGRLLQMFQKNLVSPFLLKTCGAKEIYLCLRISKLEFLTCALELAYRERDRLLQERSYKKVTPIKRRLRKQRPLTNENSHDVNVSKDHQAFKEISLNGLLDITSPNANIVPPKCNNMRYGDFDHTSIRLFDSALENIPSFSLHSMPQAHKFAKIIKSYKDPNKHKPFKKFPVFGNCPANQGKILRKTNRAVVSRLGKEANNLQNKGNCCPYNLRYRILDG